MTSSSIDLNKNGIIFYDGECSFCDKSVQFIMKRDPKRYFYFVSLQSALAARLLAEYPNHERPDSIVLLEKKGMYTESTAALRICRHLKGGWKLLLALIVLPKRLRDAAYRWFAKHRYQWFGQVDACHLPSPEERARFLELG
ncbi:thiol-disulfide oxidoreductase DCC family protein [Aureibacillus halotolerans]|uniref:Putative DCC family thiol-disulfide oxidoreductase YuxK n=1 Tax=Aureibacillus halotolerans TaxID=1508390 RepID=A0A4R6UCE1_9BACI|nr:thiol-disulfide oxidoreductase DCC family protein [Aureibacillus halotolerans]TDQ42679.1 putative DCC family thiol-disulfide oxidoreductase YuxK [Aureibacillus halotolerans]